MPSPQLQTILDLLRSRAQLDADIPALRAATDGASGLLPLAEGVRAEPVDAGGLRGEWLIPDDAEPGRTLLHLHGGGYVICSIASHRSFVSRIAKAARARTLLVDYRLAPEHPFPAALEDAQAAYRWLAGQGADPAHTALAGDSAGGGLVAALLLLLRDAGEPLPAAAVLLSPWLDLACEGESMSGKAGADPLVTAEVLRGWGSLYLQGADPHEPLASPLYGDLASLPPLLIQAGAAEVLLDDSVRFAERAGAAGVDVTLEPWEDMVHVWHAFAFILPEGQQAIDRVGAWLGQRIGNG